MPWHGDDKNKLKPFYTTDRHLYLIPGLFLQPLSKPASSRSRRRSHANKLKRFTAKCDRDCRQGGRRPRALAVDRSLVQSRRSRSRDRHRLQSRRIAERENSKVASHSPSLVFPGTQGRGSALCVCLGCRSCPQPSVRRFVRQMSAHARPKSGAAQPRRDRLGSRLYALGYGRRRTPPRARTSQSAHCPGVMVPVHPRTGVACLWRGSRALCGAGSADTRACSRLELTRLIGACDGSPP